MLRNDVKKIPYLLLLLACLLRVLHIPPSLAYQYEQGVIWWVCLIAYIALWLESEQNTVYIKFVKNNVREMDRFFLYIKFVKNNVREMDRNYLILTINTRLFTMKVENHDITSHLKFQKLGKKIRKTSKNKNFGHLYLIYFFPIF